MLAVLVRQVQSRMVVVVDEVALLAVAAVGGEGRRAGEGRGPGKVYEIGPL